MTPCILFDTQDQANRYLAEWQERLYLSDWAIKVKLAKPEEYPNDKGHISFQLLSKSACIHIMSPDVDSNTRLIKYCAEQILVHELLHCKYNLLELDDSYEEKFLDEYQHQQLEMLSRSLICAKYDLKPDWFKNVEDK